MDEKQQNKSFLEKTEKETKVWDWLSRILPLVALSLITLTHFTDRTEIRDIVLNCVVVLFLTICFIWWYWAIRHIFNTVKHLRNAEKTFLDMAIELSKFKKDLDQNAGNRER